jgi:hypothetical protein
MQTRIVRTLKKFLPGCMGCFRQHSTSINSCLSFTEGWLAVSLDWKDRLLRVGFGVSFLIPLHFILSCDRFGDLFSLVTVPSMMIRCSAELLLALSVFCSSVNEDM